MNTITPVRKTVGGFIVAGITTRTRNQDETDPSTAKISPLWQQFLQEGIANKIPSPLSESDIHGVYSDYESDETGFYHLTAGKATDQNNLTNDWHQVSIIPGEYLIFTKKGTMPQIIHEAWQTVWAYFSNPKAEKRAFQTDFEVYNGDDEVSIYIGIR